ncbi:hypothetical protein ALC62_01867 [Cyphomyrmex costatus]|uniref:RRM domain-containing protein n=1 Tax=Cyphomyrmex costatus TaxID=456900 RepID=A0A151IP23_9HYME|nr:hypothetical protein ALC62_01867 [Cyphomyrmex costatus]
MDFDKYFKKDVDGAYNLHFLNKDKLSIYEIREIFSVYGNILAINVTRDETGFRFVKYGTLHETIACLKGLKDGSKIQLLPEKSKIKDRKSYRNSNDENLLNDGGNCTNKTFNGNDRSDISNTFQNSMHNHRPIPNVTNDNSSALDRKSSVSSRQTFMENNSLDTIDYGKYYKITKDGSYSVHFANKKNLASEFIKDTFSSYGTITSIYDGGNVNGLKVITYKTLDEVINCIKGLQNDSQIYLLPEKNKSAGESRTTNQNSLNRWQASRTEDISQKTFNTDKQFNSNSTHNENNKQEKLSEYIEKPIYNIRACDFNKFDGADNFSDSTCNSRHDKSNNDATKYKNMSPQMFDEKYSFLRQHKSINNEDYSRVMRKKQEGTKLDSSTMIEVDKNRRFSTHDQKMPMLVSNTEIKLKEFDVMSNSSLSNETRSLSKIVYIPMQEIIVANIHKNYGIHYILHLFEKYSPISATIVLTISETNIRYCHVYFKTVQDAVAVEEEFDNFDLYGQNLIVLRKSRLIDETICE